MIFSFWAHEKTEEMLELADVAKHDIETPKRMILDYFLLDPRAYEDMDDG